MLEIVVAIGSVAIIVVSMAELSQILLRASKITSRKNEAVFLVQEGAEAMRFLRDKSWQNNIAAKSTSTQYFLIFQSNQYGLTSTEPALINNIFNRTIRFTDVKRNANWDIASTGGTADTSTKKITIDASWKNGNATTTERLELLLTNLFDN